MSPDLSLLMMSPSLLLRPTPCCRAGKRLQRHPYLCVINTSDVKSLAPTTATIHSFGGSGVSRVRWRESDERSFLSLRIKHSESDLPPTASAAAARDDLYFLRVIYAEERKPRLSECIPTTNEGLRIADAKRVRDWKRLEDFRRTLSPHRISPGLLGKKDKITWCCLTGQEVSPGRRAFFSRVRGLTALIANQPFVWIMVGAVIRPIGSMRHGTRGFRQKMRQL
jgi:hypothetical protein